MNLIAATRAEGGLVFSWTLRSICEFWIQNHFCAILEGPDIWKTKCGFEIDIFKLILEHSCTCGLRVAKMFQTGPWLILINPNWPLESLFLSDLWKIFLFFSILIGLQNIQWFKIIQFCSIASTYHKSPILFKIVQNWFCIQNLCKDVSF